MIGHIAIQATILCKSASPKKLNDLISNREFTLVDILSHHPIIKKGLALKKKMENDNMPDILSLQMALTKWQVPLLVIKGKKGMSSVKCMHTNHLVKTAQDKKHNPTSNKNSLR